MSPGTPVYIDRRKIASNILIGLIMGSVVGFAMWSFGEFHTSEQPFAFGSPGPLKRVVTRIFEPFSDLYHRMTRRLECHFTASNKDFDTAFLGIEHPQ